MEMEVEMEMGIDTDRRYLRYQESICRAGATTPIVCPTNYRVYKQLQLLCGQDILNNSRPCC